MKDIVIHTEKTKEEIRSVLQNFCKSKPYDHLTIVTTPFGLEMRRELHPFDLDKQMDLVFKPQFLIQFSFSTSNDFTEVTICQPDWIAATVVRILILCLYWFTYIALILTGLLETITSIAIGGAIGLVISFLNPFLYKYFKSGEALLVEEIKEQLS